MFDRHYRAVLADTEEGKSIHYHLRYQVYCLEKQFEPTDAFNNQRERDEYDEHSVHFLIQHKKTGDWVGTARLVIDQPERLPAFQITDFSLPPETRQPRACAELSRLSILKSFRRHTHQEKVSEPEVLLGLIRSVKEYSEQAGIDYWLFLCRRSIMRIVGNMGMHMDIVGDPCEHRGIRYPYLATLATAFDGIAERSPLVHQMFGRTNTLVAYSSLMDQANSAMAA